MGATVLQAVVLNLKIKKSQYLQEKQPGFWGPRRRTSAADLAWYDAGMDVGVVSILFAVVAVGVALATLTLRLNRGLERRLERQLLGQIDSLRSDLRALGQEMANVRDRVSRLEGLLEGLRDAITGRQAAAD